MTDLMKIVLVELSNEGGEIGMLEESWENMLCEFADVLYRNHELFDQLNHQRSEADFDNESGAFISPVNDFSMRAKLDHS